MCPRTEDQFSEMREQARKKILSGAIELFSESGFHGTSMDMIAKRAKVSKGLAYNYFKSKDDILKSILRHRLSELENIFDGLNTVSTPRQKIQYLVDAFLTDVERNVDIFRVYFTVFLQPKAIPVLKSLKSELPKPIQDVQVELKNLFVSLKVDNPELEVVFFFSTLQGIGADYLMSPKEYPLNEIKNLLLAKYGVHNE